MTILRGIPGSGKTHFVRTLRGDATRPVQVCSADHYFEKDGAYHFVPAKLGDAHASCYRLTVEAVIRGFEVIVDNTNTTAVEIAPYLALGRAYGYDVRIVRIVCDPMVAFERQAHGVTFVGIAAMARRLTDPLPPFFPEEEIIQAG